MSGGKKEKVGQENGFEGWGDYMSAKRAKLNAQFNESVQNGCESNIFAGMTIHINGHVNPTNLRAIFLQHGGQYETYPSASTNFVIASNLSEATKRKWGHKTVRPEWVVQSIAAGNMLDHRKFLLYDFNEEQRQKTLTQAFQLVSEPVSNKSDGEIISSSPSKIKTSPVKTTSNQEQNAIQKEESPNKANRRLMAWEDGFLEEFWDHSRLHNISTMKRLHQQHVAQLRRNRDSHKFLELIKYQEEMHSRSQNHSSVDFNLNENILFLIDLDCFFVSVGRLTRPHMINCPVAVTHFTGSKTVLSNSDIACASYEARKFGVYNGMWVSEARKLCPALEVIPYDFQAYKRVSDQFCDIVSGLTLDIEPGSCDELLVDVTSVLKSTAGSSPRNLAEYIRRRIFEDTKCKASIGIGKNRLLAKMASKRAKPDGIFIIDTVNIEECMSSRPLNEIPGIGASMIDKLISQYPNVRTCGDLSKVKLDELKNLFGAKKGEMMHNACRGIEETKLMFDYERPKSISIDINYGIRLQERSQLEKLLSNMARALSKRAEEAEAYGSKIQLTILTQQKGAPEPKKSGGHGYVDVQNKSGSLMNPTRDFPILYKSLLSLTKRVPLHVDKYRGIGIHLQSLTFDFDHSKKGQGVQQTLFTSLSKGQQRVDKIGNPNNGSCNNTIANADNIANVNLSADADISVPSLCDSETSVPEPLQKSNNNSENHLENFTVHDDRANEFSTSSSSGLKIDLSVLAALPDDIASEVRDFFSIKTPNAEPVVDSNLENNTNSNINLKNHTSTNEQEPVPSTSRAALILQNREVAQETKRKDACLKYPQVQNPFENISQLNESFMDALPEEIREEVEADFRKSKNNQVSNLNSRSRIQSPKKKVHHPSPKKNLKSKETILKSTKSGAIGTVGGAGGSENQIQSHSNAGENNVNQQGTKTNMKSEDDCVDKDKGEEKEAHRTVRILPNEKPEEVPFNRIHWWKYTNKDSLPTMSKPEGFTTVAYSGTTKLISLPALNDKTDVAQVRNIIREGIQTLPNPTSSDLKGLTDYFNQLISGHFLKHIQLLLKFIHRLSDDPGVNGKWSKIFKSIIYISQNKLKKIFGFPIQLNDIEDEDLF